MRKETHRCEYECANLYLESGVRPWVPVHNDSTNVSDHFAETTDRHESPKDPGPVAKSEDKIHNSESCEVRTEEGICTEIGVIAVDCRFNGTLKRHRSAVFGAFVVVREGF
jgi:hypothetical protein